MIPGDISFNTLDKIRVVPGTIVPGGTVYHFIYPYQPLIQVRPLLVN